MIGTHFKHVEWVQFHILDAPRQAFPGLAEQLDGSGAENKKAIGSDSLASASVYQSSQFLEYLRDPVNFIQYDQIVFEVFKEQRGVGQFVPVGLGLEVEIE